MLLRQEDGNSLWRKMNQGSHACFLKIIDGITFPYFFETVSIYVGSDAMVEERLKK